MAFSYLVMGLLALFACGTANKLYSAYEVDSSASALTATEETMIGFTGVDNDSEGTNVKVCWPAVLPGVTLCDSPLLSNPVPRWLKGHFLRQSCRTYGDTHLPYNNYNQVQHYFDCIPNLVSFYFDGTGKIQFWQRDLQTTADKIFDSYGKNMTKSQVFFPTIYSDYNTTRVHEEWPKYTASLTDVDDFPKASLMNVNGVPVATTENTLGIKIDLTQFQQVGEYPWKDKNFNTTLNDNPVAFIAATHEAVDQNGLIWKSAAQFYFTSDHTGFINVQVYKIVDDTRVVVANFSYDPFDIYNCEFLGGPGSDVRSKYRYLHSVAVTEHYVILLQTSTLIDPCDVLLANEPPIPVPIPLFKRVLKWTPTHPSGFVVIDKSNGENIKHIDVETPFFATHQVNSFEDGSGNVVMDLITYKDDAAFSTFSYLQHIYNQEDAPISNFTRFTISTTTWSASSRDLRAGKPYTSIEYPTINTAYRTKDYQYAYFCRDFFYRSGAIEKVNVATGTTTAVWLGSTLNFFPMEPIFIPSPYCVPNCVEDSGILLVQGYTSRDSGKAMVVLLRAQNLALIAYGTANDVALFGNHNRFFKDI